MILLILLGGAGLFALLLGALAWMALAGLGAEASQPAQADLQCLGERRWELDCWEKAMNHLEIAPGLESLSPILANFGDEDAREILQDAISFYEEFLKWMRSLSGESHPNLAKGEHFLAGLYFTLGDFEEAEERYRIAVKIAQEGGLHPVDTAGILNNVGMTYLRMERYEEAESYFLQSIATVPEGDFHAALATQNLGALYHLVNDPERAEALYGEALELLRKDPAAERRYGGKLRQNLALVWQTLGELAKVKTVYEELLNSETYLLSSLDRAAILNNLAETHRLQGDRGAAADVYRQVLAETNSVSMRAVVFENLGVLALEEERYDDAGGYFEEALAIHRQRKGGASWGAGVVLVNQASLELARGTPEAALDLLTQAELLLQTSLPAGHPAIQASRQLTAVAELGLGDREAALAIARQVQAQFEAQLSHVLAFGSESQRLAFHAQSSLYDLMANLGDEKAIAEAVLHNKGAVLESVLADRTLAQALRNVGDDEIVRRLRVLRWRLMQAELKAVTAGGRRDQVESIERELKEVLRMAAEKVGRPPSRRRLQVQLAAVQQALAPNRTLVEFIQYEHLVDVRTPELSYGAVVVPARGASTWVPLGPAEPINEQIDRYQKRMRHCGFPGDRGVSPGNPHKAPCAGVEEELPLLLGDLYQSIWLPIEKVVPPAAGQVVVSPDAHLSLVPIGTLLREDGRFVIEETPIVYVASGRDVSAVPDDAPGFDTALTVYAIPLNTPSAADLKSGNTSNPTLDEAAVLARIASEHGWTVETFLGEDATEKRFRARPHSGIVHLATHGFYLEEEQQKLPWALRNPMHRGFLYFSGYRETLDVWQRDLEIPSPETDDILLAEEVALLDLEGTWLTVLSACDTGLGEIRRGEGVLGLRRGFQIAGSRNLLLTLWPIYDDARTVAFMEDFYEELLSTRDTAVAWNKVKRQHLRQLREDDSLGTALKVVGGFVLTSRGELPSNR